MTRLRGSRDKVLTKAQAMTVLEALGDVGFEPVGELLKLLPDIGKLDQANIILKLMDFVYPKKTSMRFEAEVNHRYHDMVVDLDSAKLIDMAKGIVIESDSNRPSTGESDHRGIVEEG